MRDYWLSITHKVDYQTRAAGLAHFRDGVCRFTAPAWSHFVGKTLDEVVRICEERGYTYDEVEK